MIGPYSAFAWIGYTVCNAVIPFMRGADNESFWLTLLFAPLWGFVFVMAFGKQLRKGTRAGLPHFVFFNALLALPAVVGFYWAGTLLS